MTKRKSPELSGALISTTDKLEYMAEYPSQMRHTTDIHLALTSCTLPVHSFVLMAFSPYFSEMVALHQTETRKTSVVQLLKVPMQSIAEEALQAALAYLYMELRPGAAKPMVTDIQQATQLAEFGHSFKVPVLHEAADVFIDKWLHLTGFDDLKNFGLEPIFGSHTLTDIAYKIAYKIVGETGRQALGVIDMTSFAETYVLPKSLESCANWLAQHFAQIAVAHQQLSVLTPDTTLKIMRSLSKMPAQKAGSIVYQQTPL